MAKTKADVLARLAAERRRLEKNLAGLTPEQMVQPGVVGEWSVKDVLAHLAGWEQLFLGWCAACGRGEEPATPVPGLTWSQLDVLNQRLYEQHHDDPLPAVRAWFDNVHREFMALVEAMPDDEILSTGHLAFTGRHTLADWLGHYARHDAWAKNEVRRWLQGRPTPAAH